MKRPEPKPDWPESWKLSYHYDRMEVFGEEPRSAYASAYRERRRHSLELVAAAARPGARVLDVAAGQGNFTLCLAEQGYDVTWNDLRAELADYVRLKHEKGTVRYAPGNALELRFDEPFDVVLATEIVEHVAHPDEALRKLTALVKPGGQLVVSTPNGAYFRNRLPRFSDFPDPSVFESRQFQPDGDGHIFLLEPEELAGLARRAGLRILESRLFCNPLTHGHLKLRHLLPWVPAAWVAAAETASARLPAPLRRKLMTSMVARLSA
jgi:2-polyprenyl-6-hydroxyphenyl methylase/3-demethylubiquinone-9 3-methyltransferase